MASSRHCPLSGASLSKALPKSRPTRAVPKVQRRGYAIGSDIQITRTGKPIVSVSGGRSDLHFACHTATVFGATGFLGRYIVNRLARTGNTVVVPYREEMFKRHLKVTGDLGRVNFMEMDLRNTASIEESVRHSDIVYNLIGRDYPTKNFDLEDVHVEGVERIAEACAKYDVDRFVHVSSFNANKNSHSEFYRTKGLGEEVARSIFPETTIVRPSPCFGYEDRLLNRLASVTHFLTSNNMQERFRPVHAIDVGMALEAMMHDDSTASQTYELFGPEEFSMEEVAELVDREIISHRRHINIPKFIMKPFLNVLNKALWWPVGSADEVEREFIDQIVDKKAKTFKDLDIEPVSVKSQLYRYLQEYRISKYQDLPPMSEREKREEKKYLHVIDNQ
ncbi:NADH-ubiquinone oxidoreductase-like protein 40 kDa subunit [Aulographum hederae CBS 113979]|uniref:NADH-ubiquinone oxidoreductase-like protein 40 kDa subunit n=1 Tax=Aulographum hederae CBS 113979 TaxID=1176131 RepID=A0A6G1H3L1_9PEZI|nr:NADH-ubiquinone oxidoreductase-like protein 40 kDa subunit [Aulographum hederae CBS 113979]